MSDAPSNTLGGEGSAGRGEDLQRERGAGVMCVRVCVSCVCLGLGRVEEGG